jgi:putative transposase
MKPSKTQEAALVRLAGARRFLWNWGLERWKNHYETTGKSLGYVGLSAELTVLKRQSETAWLKEFDAQTIREALKDLDRAFVNFFKKRARYPRFKNRKRDALRFRIPRAVKLDQGKVHIPKLGWIRVRQHRDVAERIKLASFRRQADGHWYVSLIVEFEMPDVALLVPDPDKVVGIDLGLKNFVVLSDERRVLPPKFYVRAQRKLRRAQRVVSRRKPGSNRRAKAKLRVARIHQKINDQRGDFLHKLTIDLIGKYDGIAIEDLNVRGFARTKLAKSFTDASMGEFRRQLEYKSLWNRRHLAVIDRSYPSSRLCRACGAINEALTLGDRQWVCKCGMVHDRDLSTAINVRDEGLRLLAAGHAERQNARGACARLATASGEQ